MKTGKYRHYKGKNYELIGICTHSESLEKMVLYKQMYGEESLWVRPISMWNEEVNLNGEKVKRFTYIGE